MPFVKGKSGNPAGRPKRQIKEFSEEAQELAHSRLMAALSEGEPWAVSLVIDRTMPKLKAVTPADSLDGELLALKVKELGEFEERLKALEEAAANE